MSIPVLVRNCTVLVMPVLGVVAGGGSRAETVSVGQPMPDLRLQGVLGGDGRERLSEFRGQPVLIAHWGMKGFAPLDAVRVALDLEEKHADEGLAVFLMARTGGDAATLRAHQLDALPGVTTPILTEQELSVAWDEDGYPPRLALVGVDGTLLFAGSFQHASRLGDLVEAELKKVARGWGEDGGVREARALAFGKGAPGAARALLADAADEESARALREIEQCFASRRGAVVHALESGRPSLAARLGAVLADAARGHAAWEEEAASTSASLAGEGFERELELERRLDKLLKPLARKAPKKGLDGKLRALAEEGAGTAVGERAGRMADAVARALQGFE